MSEQSITGGCLCSAIRYAIDGPPLEICVCHCVSCRRSAGADSVAWITVPRSNFHLTAGEPLFHASSPGVARGFCGTCGTSLTYAREGEDWIDATLGSFDDPNAVQPRAEAWLEERIGWNPANPDLRPFARGITERMENDPSGS